MKGPPIQWQMDHLEFRDGPHISAGGGRDRHPAPHRWGPVEWPATWYRPAWVDPEAQRCTRCGITRFHRGDAEYSFQTTTGMRRGAEPRCTKGRRTGR